METQTQGILYAEDNQLYVKDAIQIERCEWCKEDTLPCQDCADRARGLEKQGYIILLEDGWCIPLSDGHDGDGDND